MREIVIGFALALTVFLALMGYDITPILLIGAAVFLTKFMVDGGRGFGKKFEVVGGGESSSASSPVTFADIGGQEVAKREFIEALEFMKSDERARRLGIRPLKGVLLTGPPGTGKTLMAKAAANYTDSVFVAASGSQFVEMYAGVGAQRVRALFKKARSMSEQQKKKNAIIFIDEIDVLGGKRGKNNNHLEYDQTLNQLLVEMDGMTTSDSVRVLVVAATNRVDLLDPALLRPGRFDRIVKVDLPDKEGRLHILKIHTRGKPLAKDVDLVSVARDTFGFSGAHLESVVNEAAIHALREGRDSISSDDFREAIEKVMMGEKLDRKPTPDEIRRIAYHEVGHAAVSELVRPGSVASVTITSRGRALGYTRQSPGDDQYLFTLEELEGQIAICMAGAAAEQLAFGCPSTGSAGDFEQAAKLAKDLVYSGMSKLGVVSKEDVPPKELHSVVQDILKEQKQKALRYLDGMWADIEQVVDALIENERFSGDEFRSMLGLPPGPQRPERQLASA